MEPTSSFDLYEELLDKGNSFCKYEKTYGVYIREPLSNIYSKTIKFDMQVHSADKQNLKPYIVTILKVDKHPVACDTIMYIGDNQKIELHKYYYVKGKVQKLDYAGIPIIGYYKQTSGYIPPKKMFETPYIPNETIAPKYQIPEMPELKNKQYYVDEYGLSDLTRYKVKTPHDLIEEKGLMQQRVFKQIYDYLDVPILQIYNSKGKPDALSTEVLDFYTGKKWKIFNGWLVNNVNEVSQCLYVKYVKDIQSLMSDFPVVNIEN